MKHWNLQDAPDQEALLQRLNSLSPIADMLPAVVLSTGDDGAQVLLRGYGTAHMAFSTMTWAQPYINEDRQGATPKKASDVVKPGDVVYVTPEEPLPEDNEPAAIEPESIKAEENPGENVSAKSEAPKQKPVVEVGLAQIPKVEGALVSMIPQTGAVQALVGGFSFSDSKYNRALLAKRQPGSNFKPFLYLAALQNGSTAATIINDAPIVFDDSQLETSWRPENSGGHFNGPTRLRQALYQSRNLVSIRLLRATGIDTVLNYVKNLGLDTSTLPHNLSLALGSGTLTPMDVARGFAVIANGGYSIQPYLVQSIHDGRRQGSVPRVQGGAL